MSVPQQDSAAQDPAAQDAAAPEPAVPSVVRRLVSPAALAVADLAAVFEDLQTVLRCCERLVTELDAARPEPDDLALEAYWTLALLSYTRCFTSGPRGTGLTEDDVTATELPGDVVGWHQMLMQLRERVADPGVNPRESFSVGASLGSNGKAEGIAVASTRQPSVDAVSVRQTGAVAYALSRIVDERLTAQQGVVFTAVGAMARPALERLALLHLAAPE